MWKIGIECGQKFLRLSSWIRPFPFFRKLTGGGFAVGPVMVYKED